MNWKYVSKIQYGTSLIFLIFPIQSLFEPSSIWIRILKLFAIILYVFTVFYMMRGNKKFLFPVFICMIATITIFIHVCNIGNIMFYLFPISFVPYGLGKSFDSIYSKITFITMMLNYLAIYAYDFQNAIIITIYIVFMIMMAISIDYFAKMSRRNYELNIKNEQLALLSSQLERNRISQDLHDSLGQVFSTLSIKSELTMKLIDKNPELAKNEVLEIQKLSQNSLFKVRSIIENIKTSTMDDEVQHVGSLLNDAGIHFESEVSYGHMDEVKHHEISMLLKELVNNIIKHSNATAVYLSIHQIDRYLKLTIKDNGKGLKTNTRLNSIETRVKAMGGTIRITNMSPGVKIDIEIEVVK